MTEINIIYQDEDFVVVHKPSGIAAQKTKSDETIFIDSENQGWKPINRLDQRVSGLLLFAKNDIAAKKLNEDLQQNKIKKYYKALVANKPSQNEAFLEHWLLKDGKTNKAKAFTKKINNAKQARLHYKLLASSIKYHLLEIELHTGRFHQIRAQLAAINCPIVGDVKYGFKRTTSDGSIFLQSYKILVEHPTTKKEMTFEIEIPEIWHRYGFSDK